MKKKKKFMLMLVIFLILFFVGLNNEIFKADKEIPLQVQDKKISLKEAYEIGMEKASNWNPNSLLFMMTSVDEEETGNEGTDGTRSKWNLVFQVPNEKESLILTIEDKEIVNYEERKDMLPKRFLINSSQIVFDSSDLVQKAKNESKLMPGSNWTKGYNFTLRKGGDGQLNFIVVGSNQEGHFTKLYFNPMTAKLTSKSVTDYSKPKNN